MNASPTGRFTRLAILSALVAAITLGIGSPVAALQGPSAPQQETRVKRLQRAADVDGRVVSVSGTGMQIDVRRGEGTEARVEASLEYWSDEDTWMERVADSYELQLRESGRRVEFDFGRMPEPPSRGLLGRLFRGNEVHWSLDVTLTVPVGTELELTNSYGPVDVHGIEGTLRVENSSGAVRVSDSLATTVRGSYAEIEIERAGGPVTVNASSAPVTVLHAKGSVDVVSSYSEVKIEDVEGDVTVEVGSGQLVVRDVRGNVDSRNTYAPATIEEVTGRVEHESSSGDVRIRQVAREVRAVGSYGEMEVRDVGPAELRNGSGSIVAEDVRGDLRVHNSYGPVEVRSIGGELQVDSSSAAVRAFDVEGGVRIVTSYDGVTVEGVGGAVDIRNGSGRVTVAGFRDGALTAAHSIQASYGGIQLTWPGGADTAIEAEATFGGITSDLPGRMEGGGSSSRQRLVREASGARLRLVATSGSILIRTE